MIPYTDIFSKTEAYLHRGSTVSYHINYIEPDVYCNKGKRSTAPVNCNWCAADERHVRTVKKDDQYIILSRKKTRRNLLISPINHRTNRGLIKDTSFWEWILGDA